MGTVEGERYDALEQAPAESEGEPQFDLTPAQRKTVLGGTPYRVAPQDKRVPIIGERLLQLQGY